MHPVESSWLPMHHHKTAMSSNIRDALYNDWHRFGATLRSFDDGHIPENLHENAASNATQLVDFEIFKRSPLVHVYENALDDFELLDELYDKTVNSNSESSGKKAWGDYVTIEQVQDFWQNCDESAALPVKLAAKYLQLALGEGPKPFQIHSRSDDKTCECLFSRNDLENAHGIAIWSLAAERGVSVEKEDLLTHCAEQIRYETNIIVPPLLAGTFQCTKDKLDGGDFYVSLKGIPQYEQIGYKSKKAALDMGDPSIRTVPFKCNQAICHLGNLPHGSTKIEKIHGDQLRVIVGFNVFCKKSGPIVQQAPEHSVAFRRKVRFQNLFSKDATFESIKKNKPLARLLVLAKREKLQREFRQARDRLANEIPRLLPSTVQELVDHFVSIPSDSSWPSTPTDLQVYLHHQILKGQYRVASTGDDKASIQARSGKGGSELISMAATIEWAHES
eukprot:scaffold3373_cov137-Cylindrotheca_fusiformis.AAC.19